MKTDKKTITLKPLTFDEALTDLLQVPPPPKGRPKRKRAKKKPGKERNKSHTTR